MTGNDGEPQAETLRFLADPATHGLAGGAVARMETHASVLFLAGDTVYKLKKPVHFRYMDFSTLDRRRRNAETELAINRRTAPELYLGLSAVTREADGRLALDGTGEAVEWLVRMRRFDQDQLLDRMAADGRLDRALVEALADATRAFHDTAAQRPEHGTVAAWRQLIANNDAELRAAAPTILAPDAIDALRDRSTAAVDRHAALIEARRAAGHVRRCHGDLHLGNVCRIDGRPVLFDALEFDEALASIDILYDLAFLLMDLWQRGLRQDASTLFNRYAQGLAPAALDDFIAGLALLPLFLATRAAVRAHISARLPDPGSAERAAAFLDLALAFLTPASPRLAAIGGLSGSGKSTVAALLAPHLAPPPGALLLRSDALRKAAFGVTGETRLPEAAYAASMSARIYQRMNDCAAGALAAGHSAILDAVFAQPDERQAARAIAAAAGAPFDGIWLDAPRDTLLQRVAARRGDISDATTDVLQRQFRYDLGGMDWTRIDATGDAARIARRLAAHVGREREMPMIRSILVPLAGPILRSELLEAGLALARRFDAYLDAFHPALDPTASAAYLGEGTTGALIETVVEAAEEELTRRLNAARALFEAQVGSADLPAGRVRFLSERGRDTDLVAARARASDLTILPQGGVRADPSITAIWETLLYESGRPVLLVPETTVATRVGAAETVLIAWTELPEAARAIAFAAPFWTNASRVVAVSTSGHKLTGLAEYAQRHGVDIEIRSLERGERGALEDGTGEALLRVAREIDADLIVMGAYTHGRLRRLIMGGTTRTVVENAAQPILMAH